MKNTILLFIFSKITLPVFYGSYSHPYFLPVASHRSHRLKAVTLVTPKNDDNSVHALSTRPVIINAAKRRNATVNSWHFYNLHFIFFIYTIYIIRYRYRVDWRFLLIRQYVFTRFSVIFHPNPVMKPTHCILVALSLCAMASYTVGCKYAVESYTTTDAMIVTEAAFIAQVSAECEDSPSNLYAEVEGQLLVAANAGPNKYQVRNLSLTPLS